jgi:glycosyltransferase involved in cell wall biosynthesis
MAGRGLGGAETYSADVILRLEEAGVHQCVVMSRKAPRYAELEKAGIRMAPSVLAVKFRPLQRFLLKRLLHKEKPDIVHCWMRRAASLLPAMPGNPQPKIIGWFGGYYDPKHFRRCAVFVGVTRDIVEHMAKNGVPAGRGFFIPTFPAIATMPPADRSALATPREAKVFLTLSRLHPKKGLDTFLRAMKNFPDAYAWIAGDGPLRRALEKLARELGISSRVRFLGWRKDRAALLRAANVCVLPSRYEPFGTVILEAWAAGTPLVACRSVGPAAHIENETNGLLVDIGDTQGLANAMRRAANDEELRQHLIEHGYATYNRNYTPEAVIQQWLQLYRNLAAS